VQWCPRNPDLLAAAFFDGTVGLHSLQSTNEATAPAPVAEPDGAALFDAPGFGQANQSNFSLKQPPKWLRRPVSSSFGYGGRLVTVGNLPNAQGRNQSSVVHLRTVVTEGSVVERVNKLQDAVDKGTLGEFAEQRSKEIAGKDEGNESWKALLSLFKANSRDELIALFGFSKAGIAAHVAETIKNVKAAAISTEQDEAAEEGTPHEPVVSFIEPEKEAEPSLEGPESPDPPQSAGPVTSETTPSEFSMSAASDGTKAADLESTTTEHSLFADDAVNGTLQTEAAADFFSSMGTIRDPLPGHVLVPHTNYAQDSSVAATIGSGPSSVASEALKSNGFAIYPKETSEMDKLITKALVLGDFESAVSLCIASDRFADAILLAVKGGEELLQKTQKAYFERQTTTLPYLRLYQSIVTNDLTDIVQNADLHEWREIFVVLCTFAKQEEFSALAEQLGQRLQFQSNLFKSSTVDNAKEKAHEFRKHAMLCYLAATKLEKIVNIWVDEMREEEESLQQNPEELPKAASRYTTHAQALQTFIEKVTAFRSATSYVDGDLTQTTDDASVKTYKLAALYDRYYEYADLLASQGLVNYAVKYLEHTPADYKGSQGSEIEFDVARERLCLAAGTTSTPKASTGQPLAAAPAAPPTTYAQPAYAANPYGVAQTQSIQQQHSRTSSYGSYNPPAISNARPPSTNPYAPPQASGAMPSQPYQNMAPPSTYPPPNSAYTPGGPSYSRPGSVNQVTVPAPPPPINSSGPGGRHPPLPPQAAPPPPKRDNSGWNDAPKVSERRHTPNHLNLANKPNPLTTPFPNAPAPAPGTPTMPYQRGQQPQALPPPPRASASTPQHSQGPSPQRGQSLTHPHQPAPPHVPQGSYMPAHPGAQGLPPPPSQFQPPPSRILSPPQGQMRPGSGGPGQFPPPPGRVLSPPQGGPPRPMSGAPSIGGPPPPSTGLARAAPPNAGPYGPSARATPPPQQLAGRPGFGLGPGPGPATGPAPGPYGPQGTARPGPPGVQGPLAPGAATQKPPGAPGDVASASHSAPNPPPKAAAKYR
jgi:protein transport protein SEC31